MITAAVVLLLLQDPAPVQDEKRIVVVDSPLNPKDAFEVPYATEWIDRADLDRRMSRTVPESLKETPGISVQKTAHGHGSPFIRGFTGFRTVYLIDGIRLNNSTFRDGPNQYWATVDPFLIDRMEVIKGPASVLYGSDAIGGAVTATTRGVDKFPESFDLRSRSFYRYASAEDSHTARQDFTAATPAAVLQGGATHRRYDDLVGGRETAELPYTGYDQFDADVKTILNVGKGRTLTVAFQADRQRDVPRTHRTIFGREFHGTIVNSSSNGSNDLRHEFDQERDLFYVQYRGEEMNGFVDEMHLSASYHRQAENLDRIRNNGDKEFRESEVRTGGLWGRFLKRTSIGTLTFGADFYVDAVQTDGFNRTAGGVETLFDRGEIADDSIYDLGGLYVQDEVTVAERLDLTLGLRYTYARIHANEVDPAGIGAPPLDEFEESYHNVSGSARFLYRWSDQLNLLGGISQGFRAPNLDDTTAIRLVLSGQTDFPNPDVDPERSVNFELGARTRYGSFTGSAIFFYTILDDFIARRPEPSLGPTAFVKDNFSDGYVYGAEFYGEYAMASTWTFWGDVTWSLGNLDALVGGVTTERPLSKMNPAMGHFGIRYSPKGSHYFVEGVFTAARRQERLSPSDETDTSRIPPGGTPGYTVVTLRGGVELLVNVKATVALENVSDKDYRTHGSGVNEPGTNFVFGLDVKF